MTTVSELFESRDVFFLSVTVGLAMLTYTKPVYKPAGDVIIAFLSVFSFLNPFSAVAYLAASQNMPYPPRIPFTTAQLSVIGFVVYLLVFNQFKAATTGGLRVLAWLWPLILWAHVVKDLIVWQNVAMMKIVIYAYASAVIAATYEPKVRGRYQLWFFSFAVGGMVGVAGYIFSKLGIAANVDMVYAPERGIERLYLAGRQNEIGICLASGVGGMLGVFTYFFRYGAQTRPMQRQLYWIGLSSIVFTVLGTLTTMATLSRGGTMGLLSAFAGWGAWIIYLQRFAPAPRVRRVNLFVPLCALGVLLVALACIPQTGILKQIDAMRRASKSQAHSQGGGSVLTAGRSIEWSDSLRFIVTHPIAGYMPGDKYERHSYFNQTELPLSHNVFLDAARAYGLMGLAFYVLYFCGPTYVLIQRTGWVKAGPAFLTFFPIFVLLNTLSHGNHKMLHTYEGMAIAIVAALGAKASRNKPKPALLRSGSNAISAPSSQPSSSSRGVDPQASGRPPLRPANA